MFHRPANAFAGAAVLLLACSFEAGGNGVTHGLGSGDDPSTGELPETTTTDDPDTNDPSSDTPDESEGSTSSVAESSDDGPGSPARIVFVPDALDFGNIAAAEDKLLDLDIRNAGGSTAMLLTEVLIPGPFGLAGGFPGAGGTCGSELAPGESCTLEVGFHPDVVGPAMSSLELSYYDGVDLSAPVEAPAVALVGGAVGETDNLVLNPSAESSLDSWTMMGSTWEATNVDAVDGTFAFEAGNPALGTTTLVQTISLSQWSHPLAVGGVHFHFQGSAKAPESGSSYRIDLEFDTGSQSPLQGTNSAWDPADLTGPVPLGATTVNVSLTCTALALSACGARFDALALSLVYPAPS